MLAAVLRCWSIGDGHLGSLFYAAAVRSMGLSWSNFAFAAFDPAGTITIDKPPLALWLQVIATKIVGFNGFALHLPSALAGTAAVPLLYAATRRGLGTPTALVASLLLAVFPESVATARDTTMDAILLVLLTVGAWLFVGAVEDHSGPRLLAAAVVVGLLFNVKMFEGFVVLPAAFLYLGMRWRRALSEHARSLAMAGVVALALSLSWIAFVDLVPSDARPRVMNSRSNSALDLALRYNGLERILPGDVVIFEPLPGAGPQAIAASAAAARRFGVGEAGAPRLLRGSNGLLLGTTAIVAVAGIALAVWQRRDWLAGPGSFWTAWCATGLVMFSFSNRAAAQYTEAYAPALVVLAALGLVEAWRLAGRRGLGLASLLLALALLTEVGAALHPPLRDRLVAAAILEGASAAVVVLVVLCGRWLRGRLTIITGASAAAALATPVVTSMWIAFEAPREARAITLPNPLVYASAARPEPYVPLPIAAIDALPERPGARYRLAIDGISRSGETIALTGESVLPVWNEFLRAPVLDGSDLDELFARGDVPWVVLSRQLVASGLLRELQSHIERFCIAATGRGFGPGWLLYRCAPAPSSP